MTLIELMVALSIGSFLMIGAMKVFMESRAAYRINEAVARLEENARYVFDVIEPDIRMANYWGLAARSYSIENRAGPEDAASPLAAAGDCGTNWSIDVEHAVAASNNGYGFACSAYGTAMGTADTLVIRRVATPVVSSPAANTLYIRSSRGAAAALFQGPDLPAGFTEDGSESHALVVNGYYVDQSSSVFDSDGNPLPSLRRKTLQSGAGGPTIRDEEVLPGVEDLQIQFGVDTDTSGAAGRGIVDRYVNPDDAILDESDAAYNPEAEILAVRIWLRLRADLAERGLAVNPGFTYADQDTGAFDDDFRRMVISKTIYLRNERPAE
jgi:type IV pilus assembly protein PilW